MTGTFQHVSVLLSFVYALALTHLFAGVGRLIVARDKVRFSGLLSLNIAIVLCLIFDNWLALWDFRGVASWDLLTITVQFSFAAAIYFCAQLTVPECPAGEKIDMEAYFWHQRRAIVGTQVVTCLLAMAANAQYLQTAGLAKFLEVNMSIVPGMLLILVRLLFTARWLQWAASLATFALLLGMTIFFNHALN